MKKRTKTYVNVCKREQPLCHQSVFDQPSITFGLFAFRKLIGGSFSTNTPSLLAYLLFLSLSEARFRPTLHHFWPKWNTADAADAADAADGADGATETTPPAAPRSLVPHALGARITGVHKQTPSKNLGWAVTRLNRALPKQKTVPRKKQLASSPGQVAERDLAWTRLSAWSGWLGWLAGSNPTPSMA